MATLKRMRDTLTEGFASYSLQAQPHLVLLRPAFYRLKMKPLFLEWALLWLHVQAPFRRDLLLWCASDTGSSSLNYNSRLLELYLLANHASPASWAPATQEAINTVKQRLSEASIQLLNMIKGMHTHSFPLKLAITGICQVLFRCADWLDTFLPHCLSKINRVHYGLIQPQNWKVCATFS